MKTKIFLLIGAVALVTFSFTFANSNSSLIEKSDKTPKTTTAPSHVVGFIADEVVK